MHCCYLNDLDIYITLSITSAKVTYIMFVSRCLDDIHSGVEF